jgi:serine protease AprX
MFQVTLMTNVRNSIRWTASTFVVIAFMGLSVSARAQETTSADKFDTAVREAVQGGHSVRAIVRFKDDASRSRGVSTVTGRGGHVARTHNSIRALNVVVDAATATVLAADTGVASISLDAEVRSSGLATQSGRSSGASKARQRYNRLGSGITVAVIDSGVQPHADLPTSRIRKFVDFVNGRSLPYDDFGHGTHVAGIVAGSGAASSTLESPYTGVAPGVDVVALKVLDGKGAGKTSDVIAALEWVAANHTLYNIRVVNMSLGHPVYEPAASDPLVQAADTLVAKGIVVVASAGNLGIDPRDNAVGYGGVTSPANGPSVIAVGAVDSKGTDARGDDTVTDYSSRGPTRFDLTVKPDLVAPGHHIVSLAAPAGYIYQNYPALHVAAGAETAASYQTLSGTSMAAPAVAGTAALMLDANPRLSAGAVRALLEFTAQHLAGTDLMTQGAGYLNALGAVRLAGAIKPRVELGKIWLRMHSSVPVPYDEFSGEQVVWSKNIIWGQHVMLGDSAYVHLAAWDDNIVWGQDDNIVWGQDDNIVWGQDDNIVWGQDDNIIWGQCSSEGCDNIIWGQDDNIIWGQSTLESVVWGRCETANCTDVVAGQDDNIIWGQDNIIWGQDNIIWGQDNIIWGQDNIIWGQNGAVLGYWSDNTTWGFWSDQVTPSSVTQSTADNIIWGQDYLDNIIWGQDNIIWGQDNIIWGQNLAILTEGGR